MKALAGEMKTLEEKKTLGKMKSLRKGQKGFY